MAGAGGGRTTPRNPAGAKSCRKEQAWGEAGKQKI